MLLWLAELACMRAIEGTLEEGRMTLGFAHDVQHLAPTPLGWTIRLEAALEKIDGKLLTFLIEGNDGSERILAGRHTRAIVDRDRFLSRFEEKSCSHV
ncbi:hypothetical protein H1W37_08705 [Stappia taiwanensis]|uniref:Fluoroacetyl-CoA-specific thioesterase-like domain-containing protein n=1 Tax=Stappia taiwanensis TaxID=992267 RepID=A0A838XPL0_9HYPH|nr:hypothetical protein [Stappia taiwanensis]MBA4611727.1 hypothetical protein [Stappia taiwanensis]GGE97270.1 hypothetical protein GCM10007285_26110 [Stappia taiwanensis]